MNSSSSVRTHLSEDAAVRKAEKKLLERIEKTRAEVKRVDLFSALCAFATFGLGVLFVGILFDHWILPNGFSQRGRLIYFVFWVASTSIFFAFRLFPALRRRVNPLFAAKTLEDGWGDAHNLTINWLQLRRSAGRRNASPTSSKADLESASESSNETQTPISNTSFDALKEAMLRGVVLQAAKKAESAPLETSVDCAPLIRWGVAFAIVVAVCAVYSIFSPKNPFASAGRVAAPLAKIDRPQAIRFEKIAPGDAVAFQGDSFDVDAKIPGAGPLPVVLLYSTEDGRSTDLELPMKALGGSQFQVKFPNSDAGFEENLTYRVVVGKGSRFESRSPVFRVEVRPKPSFNVEKTTLLFPEYTGLSAQTFDNQGDVRTLEGTRVELVARSNVPLAGAFFLPDGEEARAQAMKISSENSTLATFSFDLKWKLNANGEKTPEFSAYRLRSEDQNGEKNRDERLYSVETLSDLPPTVRWKTAPEGVAEVPLNDALQVEIEAEDPDFSLRAARLQTAIRDLNEGANDSRPNPTPVELPLGVPGVRDNVVPSKGATPFVGTLVLTGALVPEKLGLNVGDEVEYWAEAIDSKLPDANVSATEKRLFVVVDPISNPSSPDATKPEEPKGSKEKEKSQENGKTGQNGQGNEQGNSSQNSPNNQNGKDDAETTENADGNKGENNDGAAGAADSAGNNDSKENDDSNGVSESPNNEGGEQKSGGPNQEKKDSEKASQSNGSDAGAESESSANDEGSASDEQKGAANGSEQQSNGSSDNQNGAANDGRSSNDAENSNGSPNSQKSDSNEPNQNGESSPASDAQPSQQNGAASGKGAIDPDANPGDAFETILDFMNRDKTQNPNQNETNSASEEAASEAGNADSNSDENGTDGDVAAHSDKANENPERSNNDDETIPESPSDSSDGDRQNERPTQKRELPTRTSDEKPKDDSPRYQANNPGELDPNVKRNNDGDVAPDTNNFLAQNADPNDSRKPKTADPNANISRDPLDQTPETPGDATDPNAAEARGKNNSNASNNPNDGPFEVVREGETGSNEQEDGAEDDDSNAPQLAPNELPPDAALGGASNNGNSPEPFPAASDANQSERNGNGGGNASDQSPQKNAPKDEKKRDPASGGASDSPSGVRGGGGGSGLGELAAGKDEPIAPADAPTLQYAEKATNLVLEYLESDLKNKKIDRRLLSELGWSEDELRAFLERWKKMKIDAATNADDDAKKRYLQALENVGLTSDSDAPPVDATFERDKNRPSSAESTGESVRTKTPTALEDRVRAFRRGVSNGRHY